MRRITTALVFTLSATCSDFRGSSPDQAIRLRTCTATAKRLLVDISNKGSQLGKQFCNHYSYNFDFVNYLIGLGFLPVPGGLRSWKRSKRTSTSTGFGTSVRYPTESARCRSSSLA